MLETSRPRPGKRRALRWGTRASILALIATNAWWAWGDWMPRR